MAEISDTNETASAEPPLSPAAVRWRNFFIVVMVIFSIAIAVSPLLEHLIK